MSCWIDTKPYKFCRLLEESSAIIKEESNYINQNQYIVWGHSERYPPALSRMDENDMSNYVKLDVKDEGNPSWRLFPFFFMGKPVGIARDLCPKTLKVISQVPNLYNAGFSCLDPSFHIKPHVGYNQSVYRCHLGVSVPEGDCAIKVAGVTKKWEEGRTLIFNDSCEHEAWNFTGSKRIILIIDFLKESRG